jgi:hypothetical protein
MFAKAMWSGSRDSAVHDHFYVSAIYEWAQIDWKDRYFDTTFGSFGPFQAYTEEIGDALRNPAVMNLLREVPSLAAVIDQIDPNSPGPNPSNGYRTPGPRVTGPHAEDAVNRKSPVLWDPFINLVGKLQLSLHKANLAKNQGAPRPSPVMFLPDPVLTWVLLAYESSADEGAAHGDRIITWNRDIKWKDEAARHHIYDYPLVFDFDADQVKDTCTALGIPIKDRCSYKDLQIDLSKPPPWRAGDTPPWN